MQENYSHLFGQFYKNSDSLDEWELKLRKWAKSPSETELEKCERAVRMIKQAIDEDDKLSKMDIEVFAKGSFPNRTNIPSDSDVDVGVMAKKYYLNDYPPGTSSLDFGFIDADYRFEEFRADVIKAIVAKFGSPEVTIGTKSIKVRSNSARVDADVVPHFVHRRYAADKSYVEGVALKDTSGNGIHNWPQQDYDNGVAKNERTGKRYKAIVRVIKNLKGQLIDEGYESAEAAPSYLIACLVWNALDELLTAEKYSETLVQVLNYLVAATTSQQQVKDWGEVNELKYLFRDAQPWKLADVHAFLVDALKYAKEKTS